MMPFGGIAAAAAAVAAVTAVAVLLLRHGVAVSQTVMMFKIYGTDVERHTWCMVLGVRFQSEEK